MKIPLALIRSKYQRKSPLARELFFSRFARTNGRRSQIEQIYSNLFPICLICTDLYDFCPLGHSLFSHHIATYYEHHFQSYRNFSARMDFYAGRLARPTDITNNLPQQHPLARQQTTPLSHRRGVGGEAVGEGLGVRLYFIPVRLLKLIRTPLSSTIMSLPPLLPLLTVGLRSPSKISRHMVLISQTRWRVSRLSPL